jgi:hypothetical protein
VLLLRAADKGFERAVLAPMTAAAARAYLGRLAGDLLAGIYPWFLPCEAILGWEKKDPRPDLTDFILMLREDNWTRFTSDYGPVPDARDYPTPPEDDALDVVARRFQPFFDARRARDGANGTRPPRKKR